MLIVDVMLDDIPIVDVMLDDIPIVDVGLVVDDILIVDVILLSELGAGSGSIDVLYIIPGSGSAPVVLAAATKTAECTAQRHQTGMGVMMMKNFLCEQK